MPDIASIQTTLDSLHQNWCRARTQMPGYFARKGSSLCVFYMINVSLPSVEDITEQLKNPTSHKRLEVTGQWNRFSGALQKFQHDLLLCGPTLTDDENMTDWLAGFSLRLSTSGMVLQVHHFNGTASVLHSSREIAQALTEHADLNHRSNFKDFQIEGPSGHVFGRIKAHSSANAVARFHALTLRCFNKDRPLARPL
jgi:hypothetical protein